MLNPVNHARTPGEVERYKVEPYVVAADVYAHPDHIGRGGWTWYTGSAAWMYRAGLESILGLERRGATLRLDPNIPVTWAGFTITIRDGSTRYDITIENPQHRSSGIAEVLLDGRAVDAEAIPWIHDGNTHTVRALLGQPVESSV